MEIVTRRVKSLLKKVEDPNAEKFDLFMHQVLLSFLTGNQFWLYRGKRKNSN